MFAAYLTREHFVGVQTVRDMKQKQKKARSCVRITYIMNKSQLHFLFVTQKSTRLDYPCFTIIRASTHTLAWVFESTLRLICSLKKRVCLRMYWSVVTVFEL